MVGVKHEHAPAGSDGSLTRREQRAMLFFRPKANIHAPTNTCTYIHSFIHDENWGKDGNDDDGNDGWRTCE
jgi:hypothetical protein